jgi:hypothetical protein
MRRHIPIVLVISALVLSLSCTLSQQEQPRTYYEGLNLETPEAAVETFVDAFQRDDFMTVYLVLAPQAQMQWRQRIQLLSYQELFQCDGEECRQIAEDTFPDGIFEGEHSPDTWYYFDQSMLTAKEHDALLIDLSGEVEITDTDDSETYDGEDAVDVIATVEGIEGQIAFRMVQAPSDRWRVLQVIVPDGDEEMVPWAMPKEPEPVRIEASAVIQVPCSDDPPPPSQATPGQPYLIAEPTCGDLSAQDDDLNTVPGTTLALTGGGFEPNTETEIWWEDPLGNSFRVRQEGEYLTATTDDEGGFQIDVVMPYRLMPPSTEGEAQLHRVLAVQKIPSGGP